MGFTVILAMDNDPAGYNAVWRTLLNCCSTMSLSMPDVRGMSKRVYQTWLKEASVIDIKDELDRLLLEEPDNVPSWRAEFCLAEYKFREDVENYKDPLQKYKDVFKSASVNACK